MCPSSDFLRELIVLQGTLTARLLPPFCAACLTRRSFVPFSGCPSPSSMSFLVPIPPRDTPRAQSSLRRAARRGYPLPYAQILSTASFAHCSLAIVPRICPLPNRIKATRDSPSHSRPRTSWLPRCLQRRPCNPRLGDDDILAMASSWRCLDCKRRQGSGVKDRAQSHCPRAAKDSIGALGNNTCNSASKVLCCPRHIWPAFPGTFPFVRPSFNRTQSRSYYGLFR